MYEDLKSAVGLGEEICVVIVLLGRHLLNLPEVVQLEMPWLALLHCQIFELDLVAFNIAILVR